ncbi:hypothetical protein WKR88_17915 [Trinickia caryophylli]|uniref:Uncharacterized protein n=1 Tax=Trinickia caryophylli TaxID=28094 RepID=A0A1X7DZM2_TRICW|nr:hypothetical protein [Trinickia caryophylli]PMS14134.1 hypothetical protein C0Z17_00920 [Trinickia caryophylli]TRX17833.1 hypothetical protein FNF07_06060 [Trinickia caryophylli]WQE11399.1 hypothetical protein U0034_16855 [Trinickia caryophylli]SMF24101.1 hypothetical protein SAMN06295900_104254 [Trinickia caryophylli]GLU32560.1 hypothetical protein Busp01_24020 [Trinickia caryophylli]
MDHRVWALSISDIASSWKKESKRDYTFEILYSIAYGELRVTDPLVDSMILDTEREVDEFLSRNKDYSLHYLHSGDGPIVMKDSHFTAMSEVIQYGGPKTVDVYELASTCNQLCIRKEDFHKWAERKGLPLPKFWFDGIDLDMSSSDEGQAAPSAATVIDVPSDLSRRERESLQKQIAALALVLAEKSAKYKNGDKPNANQIAEAVALVLNALPDANTRGVSSASLRASIKAGIAMLQDKREEVE